jgi:hypothetical protein
LLSMRRQGGGFGFVMLLVVVAVIALIALKNWKAVAPTALDIQKHNKDRGAGHEVQPESYAPEAAPTSASDDSWTPTPPSRPSLSTMEQRTDAHSAAVQDALKQAN